MKDVVKTQRTCPPAPRQRNGMFPRRGNNGQTCPCLAVISAALRQRAWCAQPRTLQGGSLLLPVVVDAGTVGAGVHRRADWHKRCCCVFDAARRCEDHRVPPARQSTARHHHGLVLLLRALFPPSSPMYASKQQIISLSADPPRSAHLVSTAVDI